MRHLDLLVVGSGSGNSLVTPDFEDWSIGIVERETRWYGGTCLNVGCIPTKMFAYPADVARIVTESGRLGVDATLDGVRWKDLRDRVFGRIDAISAGGRAYRAGGSEAGNTTLFEGTAAFTGPRAMRVTAADGSTQDLTAERVVLANGSRPVIPPIPGLDPSHGPVVEFHTNETVMRIDEVPERVVVLGSGYIAAEFSHVLSSFGARVTVVGRSGALLRAMDATISAQFTALAGTKWDLQLDSEAVAARQDEDGIHLDLADGSVVSGDLLLVATGRVPNSDTLDCAAGGVEVRPDGRIVADAHQRTTADGVWTLGDVSSPYQLKHVANHESRVVAHNLAHPDDLVASDHRFVPSAVFTEPQIASVGLTEARAREAGHDVVTAEQAYGDVAYGWAMADSSGLVKLVAERGTGHLLGAHLLGYQASTVIQPLIQALALGPTDVRTAGARAVLDPPRAGRGRRERPARPRRLRRGAAPWSRSPGNGSSSSSATLWTGCPTSWPGCCPTSWSWSRTSRRGAGQSCSACTRGYR